MKYLKKYNESKEIIKSDNIFYFDDPDIKSIIEDTLSNVRDLVSSYKINRGWIRCSESGSDFSHDKHIDLKFYSRMRNMNLYE